MSQTWETGGTWANETIRQELKKVEKAGQLLANRLLRNKLIMLAIAVGAMMICLFYLEPITALAVELVIFVIMVNYLRKTGRQAQSALYQQCDPYLQFAYIRAYAQKPFPKGKQAATREILSMAQCMSMAGEPQAAIAIQSTIKEPEKMKIGEKTIYYNTLLNCYGLYGWADKRNALAAELRAMRAKAGKMEIMQLDVILRLEELKRHEESGDIDFVLDYFKKIPPVLRFQEVAMHYGLAMLYMKAGDAESAREHVEFVLKYGNKLYYKRNLEDYLRRSLEDD